MPLLQLPRFICREALGTQGHSLINPHTFADNRGFPDDHACPVVNKEASADLRAGVNVDTGGRVGDFCADPRQQGQSGSVQMMGESMVNHRQNPRIAQQHFIHTAGRRVAVIRGQHVGIQNAAQAR